MKYKIDRCNKLNIQTDPAESGLAFDFNLVPQSKENLRMKRLKYYFNTIIRKNSEWKV
jgi:hypothetical protein